MLEGPRRACCKIPECLGTGDAAGGASPRFEACADSELPEATASAEFTPT